MSVCLGQTVPRWGPVGGPAQDACALPRNRMMARPRVSEPRDQQFNLSLTRTELESIKKRADALGMRPVHFGRALVLDRERRVVTQDEAGSAIQRLLYGQLVRLGNNLNQMVRHLHQTGDPLPSDLEPLLKDIRQIIARVQP